MIRISIVMVGALLLSSSAWAQAQKVVQQSERTASVELKLGSYRPLIGSESGLKSDPYAEVFGNGGMLLAALQLDRMVWQGFGTLSVGLSGGYGEKFGSARAAETGEPSSERTSLHVVPLKAQLTYRLDVPALRFGIPLVPYVRGGLIYTPWWSTRGEGLDNSAGARAQGGKWGYGGTLGLAFLLDVLDPRLARDFDSDTGVNHSYLFAEYLHEDVDDFGRGGLTLSARYWLFGLALEY